MERWSMRLLESMLPDDCFPDIVVLHINHCMENSFYFSEQLQKVFGEVVFIAAPYNDRVVPEILSYAAYHGAQTDKGYRLSRNNRVVEDYAGNFLDAIQKMILLALENDIAKCLLTGKKLLIIEDGGYHYAILQRWLEEHPLWKERILGAVEQTTAGTRSAQENKGRSYPVISVARSAYKTRIEAYFVAERVVGELQRFLRRLDSFLDFHDVLLLGYGVIGRSIAGCLASHHVRMSVRDVNEHVCRAALQDGLTLWDGTFKEDMLILGNVGKPSFSAEMLNSFLKGDARRIILASSSSKEVEFQGIFPQLAGVERIRLDQADIYRFPGGKELVLLARGFPLNFFDKSTDSLTYGMIDPVFSEMLCAALMLCRPGCPLQNRTYLFGAAKEVGGERKELDLLKQWLKLYNLYIEVESFNRHPEEARLRRQAEESEVTNGL